MDIVASNLKHVSFYWTDRSDQPFDTAAIFTSANDLTAGYDWSSSTETFKITYNGTPTTITLDFNAETFDDILKSIQKQLPDGMSVASVERNKLKFYSLNKGPLGEFIISDLTGPNALGLTAATYNGSTSLDETIQRYLDDISGNVIHVTMAGVPTGHVRKVIVTIWHT